MIARVFFTLGIFAVNWAGISFFVIVMGIIWLAILLYAFHPHLIKKDDEDD